MSTGNGSRIHRPGDKLFCTREEAEQLAHSAYLLARQEDAKARHELALAFEARIADLEGRIAVLEPTTAIATGEPVESD